MLRQRGLDAPCTNHAGRLPSGCPGWCEFAQPDHRAVFYGRREAPEDFRPGLRLPGPIRLVEHVGEGGMGTVFRGWHEGRREPVAVKVLSSRWVDNPVARGRFLAEARALARVDSPHVVRLRGFALRKGAPYMVMNFIRGRTLADKIDGGGLPLHDAFAALGAVAGALAAIHRASIVHNDVKSSNVMVDEDGAVTLLDFGLARPYADACKLNPDEVSGTPMYMAPEVAAGRADRPSTASDVYALGVLAFEAFTGRVPFDHENPERILDMHINDEPPRLSAWARGLPPGLDALVHDCLVKEPHRRMSSAEAFARHLANIAQRSAGLVSQPRRVVR